jgi:hypothetical protein
MQAFDQVVTTILSSRKQRSTSRCACSARRLRRPLTDPDRASFTVALNAARDQVILAAGVLAGPVTDLAGEIGRLVLASLMPSRRLRISPRVVKRAMSRYNAP